MATKNNWYSNEKIVNYLMKSKLVRTQPGMLAPILTIMKYFAIQRVVGIVTVLEINR